GPLIDVLWVLRTSACENRGVEVRFGNEAERRRSAGRAGRVGFAVVPDLVPVVGCDVGCIAIQLKDEEGHRESRWNVKNSTDERRHQEQSGTTLSEHTRPPSGWAAEPDILAGQRVGLTMRLAVAVAGHHIVTFRAYG